MAEEIVGIKIQVGGQEKILSSMGEIRKELKQAQFDVLKFSEAFGASSKEATDAAKKVAQLKDAIGDAKDLVGAFNPDAKFRALSGAVQGVAGGFAALQGAMGLIGVEGENVQKTLLKVQSALALSEGLNSVMAAKDQFKNLGAVIKDVSSKAFGSLKSAIISTGIGALVIGLGLVIANFEKVKETVFGLFPGLEKFTNLVGGLVEKVTDFVGITNEADRSLAALQKTTQKGNEGIEARIKVLTAQGGKEKEIYQLTKQQGENELNFLREKLKAKGKLSDEELKKFRDLKVDQQVLDEKERKRIADADKAAKDKANAKSKEDNDKIKKDAEERAAAEAEAAKQIAQLKGEAEVLGIQDEFEAKRKAIENAVAAEILEVQKNEKLKSETKTALITALNAKADLDVRAALKEQLDAQAEDSKNSLAKQLEDERSLRAAEIQSRISQIDLENQLIDNDFQQDLERLAEKRTLLEAAEANELSNTELTEFQKFEIKKKYTDQKNALTKAEVDIEKASTQAKIENAQKISQLLSGLSDVFGKQTAAGKAFAIASATIDTYLAAQKAYQSMVGIPVVGPALAAVAAGVAVAGGIKNVKSILSVNVPGGGGSSSPNISAPTMAAAPIAPAAPIQNTRTELSQQSINQMGNANNRAYVIESDMTNSQERIKRINRAARLS
jgi:hypothetical protein